MPALAAEVALVDRNYSYSLLSRACRNNRRAKRRRPGAALWIPHRDLQLIALHERPTLLPIVAAESADDNLVVSPLFHVHHDLIRILSNDSARRPVPGLIPNRQMGRVGAREWHVQPETLSADPTAKRNDRAYGRNGTAAGRP